MRGEETYLYPTLSLLFAVGLLILLACSYCWSVYSFFLDYLGRQGVYFLDEHIFAVYIPKRSTFNSDRANKE
jgi:hypothetical protein